MKLTGIRILIYCYRGTNFNLFLCLQRSDSVKQKRCRALYDCDADNDDELSFHEGEVILVTNEQTEDEHWMEGMIEGEPSRRGMFPVSFVHMLSE